MRSGWPFEQRRDREGAEPFLFLFRTATVRERRLLTRQIRCLRSLPRPAVRQAGIKSRDARRRTSAIAGNLEGFALTVAPQNTAGVEVAFDARGLLFNDGLDLVGHADFAGLGALRSLRHLELDAGAFLQATEPVHLDLALVDEDIASVIRLNEPIALCVVEPLHCTLRHDNLPLLLTRVSGRSPAKQHLLLSKDARACENARYSIVAHLGLPVKGFLVDRTSLRPPHPGTPRQNSLNSLFYSDLRLRWRIDVRSRRVVANPPPS